MSNTTLMGRIMSPFAASRSTGPEAAYGSYVRSAVFESVSDDPAKWWGEALQLPERRNAGIKRFMEAYLHGGMAPSERPVSVIIEVPRNFINHDEVFGGGVISRLRQGLVEAHLSDYAKKNNDVRYGIRACADLAMHQFRVLTGAAVYVPKEDEPTAWNIKLSADGNVWNPQDSFELTRHHHACVLGGTVEHASQLTPRWPFGAATLTIVNSPDAKELKMISLDDALQISLRPKDGCNVISGQGADGSPKQFYLRATRLESALVPPPLADVMPELPARPAAPAPALAPAPAPSTASAPVRPLAPHQRVEPVFEPLTPVAPQAAGQPAAPSPAGLPDGSTLVADSPTQGLPDEDTHYMAPALVRPRLQLVGLAIQRPSRFTTSGVKGLQWGLDDRGQVVPPADPQCQIRFDVNAEDQIQISTRAGTSVLQPGDTVTACRGEAVLPLLAVPPQMQDAYIACLSLPYGQELALQPGETLIVGRQMEAIKPLLPLGGPGFLPGQADGNCMGLSRKHLRLTLTADKHLELAPLDINQVDLLDAEGQFLAHIDAHHPALLADGQHLVLGNYLWRFMA